MDNRSLSERDICTKFITPALRNAGWDEMLQVSEEVSFTKGRIIVRGKLVTRGQGKRADYILSYKPNIPVALIEAKDNTHTILTTSRVTDDGLVKAWTQDGFRTSWAKVVAKAGITGVTFHDLRGTAVTRLALAGSTVPEIAAITGHALKEVESILDAHYLARDGGLAESAIRKRERHEAGT